MSDERLVAKIKTRMADQWVEDEGLLDVLARGSVAGGARGQTISEATLKLVESTSAKSWKTARPSLR